MKTQQHFRIGRASLVSLVLIAIVAPGPASQARHDTDLHSDNMSLVASLDTGHGGDIAFWRDTAVVAHGAVDGDLLNDGFKLIDVSDPRAPREIGSFTCFGSANDVGVWRDLVFLSVQDPMASSDCSAPPASPGEPTWSGIRVVSIGDPANPVQVAAVGGPTFPEGISGSHTHTVVPDLEHRVATGERDPRVVIYNNNHNPAQIYEVPLRDPARARRIGQFVVGPSMGCHDTSFFLPRELMACAGSQTTNLFDVSDLERPKLLATIANPFINHNHGAGFSWDGNTLIIADENLSSFAANRCAAGTSEPVGALWFYDVTDPRAPAMISHYQVPQGIPPGTICTAHQFNVVPFEDERDILVAAWYGAGTTVVDFTDPARPKQLGYYISSPGDPERRSTLWSAYHYNGYIYTNNVYGVIGPIALTTERGFDVFSIDHPALDGALRQRSFNFGLQDPSQLVSRRT